MTVAKRPYTAERIASMLDALAAKTEHLHVDLPSWDDRTCEQQAWFLQRYYTQEELRGLMFDCLKALDNFTYEDPEWEALCEQMDPIWMALDPANQP